jgi:hypothetical protein
MEAFLRYLEIRAKPPQDSSHTAPQAEKVLPVFGGALARRPEMKLLECFKALRVQA